MPLGPVIISPDGILPSLYREMVLRRPHEFKIATLQDIRSLFPPDWNPFYAGFGNRNTDEISYKAVGVPVSRIFIINPKGELREASSTEPNRTELPVSPQTEGSSPAAASPATSLTGKVSVESSHTLASVSSLGAGSVWSLKDINESVAELFPLVFARYPGIRTAGRRIMYCSVAFAVTCSLVVATTFASNQNTTSKIVFLMVAKRSTVFSLALFILAVLAILSRYPVRMPRNFSVACSMF